MYKNLFAGAAITALALIPSCPAPLPIATFVIEAIGVTVGVVAGVVCGQLHECDVPQVGKKARRSHGFTTLARRQVILPPGVSEHAMDECRASMEGQSVTITQTASHFGTPLTYAAVSSVVFIIAAHLSCRGRWFFAPLLFGSAIRSLQTSSHMEGFTGIPAFWNLFICIYIHHAIAVLFIESFELPSGTWYERLYYAYKIWYDPQRILIWNPMPQVPGSIKASTGEVGFIVQRCTKAMIFWLLQLYIISPTFISYFQPQITDFAPSRQTYIRRMLSKDPISLVTSQETQLRITISLYWIWVDLIMLDTANIILSILFVSILRLDSPEDWPSLFGNPLNQTCQQSVQSNPGPRIEWIDKKSLLDWLEWIV
ncbi:hypothetical protein BDV95DRAFT_607769 [Massariosphaeria phaeospora]|uniref:Wax synthase domain-containing protein n=1 Tax=Massariosphaeria phaeospora TaxID=100035 RepID=A0A7C8M6Z0_9PLEO|nr:hypothetical protein BDV95DRAFT_607769 [Massariosphaeria phaeospora]